MDDSKRIRVRLSDWLMVGAILFFFLAGAAKLWEKNYPLGIALVLFAVGNGLLLYSASR